MQIEDSMLRFNEARMRRSKDELLTGAMSWKEGAREADAEAEGVTCTSTWRIDITASSSSHLSVNSRTLIGSSLKMAWPRKESTGMGQSWIVCPHAMDRRGMASCHPGLQTPDQRNKSLEGPR